MAGRIRHRALRRIPKEAQRGERAIDRLPPRHVGSLDGDGITGQREADTGDAGRHAGGRRVVRNQAVAGIGFLPEVFEGTALKRSQMIVDVVCDRSAPMTPDPGFGHRGIGHVCSPMYARREPIVAPRFRVIRLTVHDARTGGRHEWHRGCCEATL